MRRRIAVFRREFFRVRDMGQNGRVGYVGGIDLFPLRKTLRGYSVSALKGDANAALNVALLAFPQGMAYAMIAGLPIEYGILGSAVACVVGAIWARSRFVVLGPTNATSVLLMSAFAATQLSVAESMVVLPLIVLLSGLFMLAGAFAKAAGLLRYISRTVVTGYITAAALLIVANQIRHVLGVESMGGSASTFVAVIRDTALSLSTVNGSAVFLSASTFATYWALRQVAPRLPNVALCLVLMGLLSAGMQRMGFEVEMLASFSLGEWGVVFPEVDLHSVRRYVSTAIAVALLSALEGYSIGKSLAARSGDKLDANQELFNMGMANLGCAFLSGMPASGSLTRSVLGWSSGGKTPLASLYTGLIILAVAAGLGGCLMWIPKPALAVVVIVIGISLVSRHQIFLACHSTGSDAIAFYTTLAGGLLLPLDMAIYLGTGISIFLFLKKAAAPDLIEYTFTEEGRLTEKQGRAKQVPEVSIVHVEGDLFFGSADLFRDQIRRIIEDDNLYVLILRVKNAHILDATCVMALEELVKTMKEKNRHLLVSGVRARIYKVLEKSRVLDAIGRENVFREAVDNPTFSTAMAMKRAQALLGGREANVTIYVNPAASKEHSDPVVA